MKVRNIHVKTTNEIRTICEVHREIYDVLLDINIDCDIKSRLIELIQEAYTKGKHMDCKLRQYKFDYNDGWYEENKNYEISLKKRNRRNNIVI